MNKQDCYQSRQEILKRYGIGNTTLYRWIQSAEVRFPKPVQLEPRCVRWKITDLEDWEQQRQSITE